MNLFRQSIPIHSILSLLVDVASDRSRMSRESEVKRLLAAVILFYLTLFIGLAGFSSLTGEQIRVSMIMAMTILVALGVGMIVKKIVRSVSQGMVAALMIISIGFSVALTIFLFF